MRDATQFIVACDGSMVAVSHVVTIRPVKPKNGGEGRKKVTLSLANGEALEAFFPLQIRAMAPSVLPGHQSDALEIAARVWERRSIDEDDAEGPPSPVRVHFPRAKPDFA